MIRKLSFQKLSSRMTWSSSTPSFQLKPGLKRNDLLSRPRTRMPPWRSSMVVIVPKSRSIYSTRLIQGSWVRKPTAQLSAQLTLQEAIGKAIWRSWNLNKCPATWFQEYYIQAHQEATSLPIKRFVNLDLTSIRSMSLYRFNLRSSMQAQPKQRWQETES